MKKKNILWIFLAVLLLGGMIVLGNSLAKNSQEDTPPVIVNPGESDLQVPETTEPLSQEEVPTESSSAEQQGNVDEESTSASPEETTTPKPTAPAVTPPASEGEDLQARIDALVAEVYALKDYYIAQLSYLESAILSEYDALPAEEKTPERRKSMALECIDEAYALENECDSRMDEICAELSHLILKTNGRMNLINDIRYTYAKEKEQFRSSFLEKYAGYFG